LFEAADKDGNGVLDVQEVRAALTALGFEWLQDESKVRRFLCFLFETFTAECRKKGIFTSLLTVSLAELIMLPNKKGGPIDIKGRC